MKEYNLENDIGHFIRDMTDRYTVFKSPDDNNTLWIFAGALLCGKIIFGKDEGISLQIEYEPRTQCGELYRIAEKYAKK